MMTNTQMEIEMLKLAKERMEIEHAMRRQLLGLPAERNPLQQWDALVASKVAIGLSRVAALKAAGKERPDLYALQAVPKSDYKAH
jgi:hypothetical protein